MRKPVRLATLTLCLVCSLAAVALAGPEQSFREAIAAARAGDMDKAIPLFSSIIESGGAVDPKDLASAYNMRGLCHEAKGNTQQAMTDYDKAIEIDPKCAEALGNRAMLYAKLGDVPKAKADAAAAKRIDRKVKVPVFE